MSRPQKQIVDFFNHDVHAIEGRTLSIIKDEFGIAGIGFWWELLAWLGHTEGHYYNAQDIEDLEFLTRKLGFPLQDGTEILQKLAKLGAIDKILWSHRVIWSQNFVDRLASVYKKRGTPLPLKPNFCNGNCNHSEMDIIPVTETHIPVTETHIPVTETHNEKTEGGKPAVNLSTNGKGTGAIPVTETRIPVTETTKNVNKAEFPSHPGTGINPLSPHTPLLPVEESIVEDSRVISATETTTTEKSMGDIFKNYESNIGMLTPAIAERLKDLITQFSPDWIMEAIDKATRLEKRNLAYVEGILKGWKSQGKNDQRGVKNGGISKHQGNYSGNHREATIKELEDSIGPGTPLYRGTNT